MYNSFKQTAQCLSSTQEREDLKRDRSNNRDSKSAIGFPMKGGAEIIKKVGGSARVLFQ